MLPTPSPPAAGQAADFRVFQDGYFRVLLAPAHPQPTLALLDMRLALGAGPPRHQHTHEDETIYVLEGELTFRVGDDQVVARTGEAVCCPRQVPHQFKVTSPTARILMLLTPGRMAGFFSAQSELLAAEGFTEPPQGPPPAGLRTRLVALLQDEFGVQLMP